jgi:hypothetical protein
VAKEVARALLLAVRSVVDLLAGNDLGPVSSTSNRPDLRQAGGTAGY